MGDRKTNGGTPLPKPDLLATRSASALAAEAAAKPKDEESLYESLLRFHASQEGEFLSHYTAPDESVDDDRKPAARPSKPIGKARQAITRPYTRNSISEGEEAVRYEPEIPSRSPLSEYGRQQSIESLPQPRVEPSHNRVERSLPEAPRSHSTFYESSFNIDDNLKQESPRLYPTVPDEELNVSRDEQLARELSEQLELEDSWRATSEPPTDLKQLEIWVQIKEEAERKELEKALKESKWALAGQAQRISADPVSTPMPTAHADYLLSQQMAMEEWRRSQGNQSSQLQEPPSLQSYHDPDFHQLGAVGGRTSDMSHMVPPQYYTSHETPHRQSAPQMPHVRPQRQIPPQMPHVHPHPQQYSRELVRFQGENPRIPTRQPPLTHRQPVRSQNYGVSDSFQQATTRGHSSDVPHVVPPQYYTPHESPPHHPQARPPPEQQSDELLRLGRQETQHAIAIGEAHVVQCQGCWGRLHAPMAYSLVFCPNCHTVSPGLSMQRPTRTQSNRQISSTSTSHGSSRQVSGRMPETRDARFR